ncbi:IS701 family transposase [Streptosporangium sandarakinum]|nr:transposase [Streptosporangium sandarakinum]
MIDLESFSRFSTRTDHRCTLICGRSGIGKTHQRARKGSRVPSAKQGQSRLGSSSHIAALVREEILEEFCRELLGSLSRRDQRRWGWMYIRGLLVSDGRKSMRSIAATCRQPASQQNLQQFVSNSTWQWMEVRRRLARIICGNLKVTSWVISPLVIPKAGSNTVGVDTQFVSHLGRSVNCQRALGIWLAQPGMSCPMDWHLVLPPSWTDDTFRRRSAAIPSDVKSGSPWGIGLDALVTIINDWGLPVRPVVLDAREADAAEAIAELHRLRIPFIVRVNRATRFTRTGWGDGRRHEETGQSAESLARYLKEQRRVVQWQDTEQSAHQGILAAAMHVDVPGADTEPDPAPSPFTPVSTDLPPGRRAFVLIAEWRDSVQGRPSFWVSNLTRMSVPSLLACANLGRQVYRDQERISRLVGLYDFEGRSFGGWHRHVTLVSAAHAFIVLNRLHTLLGETPRAGSATTTRNAKSPWQET